MPDERLGAITPRFPDDAPLSIDGDIVSYAEPIPYVEVVPVWWKRATARVLWPWLGRGRDKPMWMEKRR